MRLPLYVLCVSACGVGDDRGPQTVRVYAPVGRAYELADERLETLTSARRVKGGASRMRGGGALVIEEAIFSGRLTASTEAQVREYELITGDGPVDAQYERDGDVLVPLDWETLSMFTFYRHMERARAYFQDLGVPEAALPTLRAYFNIRLTSMLLAWGQPLVTDNEAFTPLADSFMLFPSYLLQDGVPLAMNAGVVAHELSHAVKHHLLHGDARLPRYIQEDWGNEAVSSYRSDDEGLADFFAAVFVADPNFIEPSIPDPGLDRDLAENRAFTEEQFEALGEGAINYNPYLLGSSLASWLWDTAGDAHEERRAFAAVVVEALQALAVEIDGDYRLTRLMDLILERAPPSVRDRGCELLDERLRGGFRESGQCRLSP